MPELGIEFENFDAPNSEVTICEQPDGQFDATKSELEAALMNESKELSDANSKVTNLESSLASNEAKISELSEKL